MIDLSKFALSKKNIENYNITYSYIMYQCNLNPIHIYMT